MPMSDGEKQEAVMFSRSAEEMLAVHKEKIGGRDKATHEDIVLYDLLRHLVNAVKRLTGDQSPLVEQ